MDINKNRLALMQILEFGERFHAAYPDLVLVIGFAGPEYDPDSHLHIFGSSAYRSGSLTEFILDDLAHDERISDASLIGLYRSLMETVGEVEDPEGYKCWAPTDARGVLAYADPADRDAANTAPPAGLQFMCTIDSDLPSGTIKEVPGVLDDVELRIIQSCGGALKSYEDLMPPSAQLIKRLEGFIACLQDTGHNQLRKLNTLHTKLLLLARRYGAEPV